MRYKGSTSAFGIGYMSLFWSWICIIRPLRVIGEVEVLLGGSIDAASHNEVAHHIAHRTSWQDQPLASSFEKQHGTLVTCA